ncbi:MAG: helix-turn-helix domain-containing protein, partial [Nitrosopumilus sp.]
MELAKIPKSFDRDIDRYEQIANSVQEMLMELGLTKNESKIYLYLNKNGSTIARDVAQNQKIPRTQIYHLLNA